MLCRVYNFFPSSLVYSVFRRNCFFFISLKILIFDSSLVVCDFFSTYFLHTVLSLTLSLVRLLICLPAQAVCVLLYLCEHRKIVEKYMHVLVFVCIWLPIFLLFVFLCDHDRRLSLGKNQNIASVDHMCSLVFRVEWQHKQIVRRVSFDNRLPVVFFS